MPSANSAPIGTVVPVSEPTLPAVVLDPIEQRVLGALLEKQKTVPASYPLSGNGLRTACNQTSSREPVTDYDDRTIIDAIGRLKDRGLARTVWSGGGSRVLKYHQLLDEFLSLQPDERALITVLLLRGPQSAGELRTRTERLHSFADKDSVESKLRTMAELPSPLVRELPRRAGQQDCRWIHLLGPVAGAESTPTTAVPTVDREIVLAAGAASRDAKVAEAYARVAPAYAEKLINELDHKPFDRWLLDRVAAEASGPIADLGCGPGHCTARLAADGQTVLGIDLSPEMIEQAREHFPAADFPTVEFEVGDLGRLLRPRNAPGWAAITAWYSLVHLAASELNETIAGLTRVLEPGGLLALAVHLGDEVRHVDEWWEQPVDLDFVFHDRDQVLTAVAGAGLVDIEWYARGPYQDAEVETDRLYVLARKPISNQ